MDADAIYMSDTTAEAKELQITTEELERSIQEQEQVLASIPDTALELEEKSASPNYSQWLEQEGYSPLEEGVSIDSEWAAKAFKRTSSERSAQGEAKAEIPNLPSVARPSSVNPRGVDNTPAWMTKQPPVAQPPVAQPPVAQPPVAELPSQAQSSSSLEEGEILDRSQKGGESRVKKLSTKIILG